MNPAPLHPRLPRPPAAAQRGPDQPPAKPYAVREARLNTPTSSVHFVRQQSCRAKRDRRLDRDPGACRPGAAAYTASESAWRLSSLSNCPASYVTGPHGSAFWFLLGFLIGDLVGITLMLTGYLGISRARATLPNVPWSEVNKAFSTRPFPPGFKQEDATNRVPGKGIRAQAADAPEPRSPSARHCARATAAAAPNMGRAWLPPTAPRPAGR